MTFHPFWFYYRTHPKLQHDRGVENLKLDGSVLVADAYTPSKRQASAVQACASEPESSFLISK
jgi:hypothetical protein